MEAGAAAYLMPLWKKWKMYHGSLCWSVVLGEGAKSWISTNETIELPTVQFNENYTVDELRHIWKSHRPECLISSATGSKHETDFVNIAAQYNVTSIQFIDTWYGYMKRFLPRGKATLPDYILVIDKKAREEAILEGLPEKKLVEIGNPSWGKNRTHQKISIKNIVFVSQPIDRYYGNSLGYNEIDAWNEVIKLRNKYPDVVNQLIIAQHPSGSLLDSIDARDVIIERNSRKAIEISGSVIGIFSSLLVEAFVSNKNVISIQPGLPQTDMCSLSRHGYIPKAGSADDLYSNIVNNRKNQSVFKLKDYLTDSLARLEQFIKNRCL